MKSLWNGTERKSDFLGKGAGADKRLFGSGYVAASYAVLTAALWRRAKIALFFILGLLLKSPPTRPSRYPRTAKTNYSATEGQSRRYERKVSL